MINNELIGYIRQQLSLKITQDVISANLKSQGWTSADIDEAFTAIERVSAPIPVPVSSTASEITPNLAQMQGMPIEPSHPVHHKSKKILSIIIVLILLGLASYGVYAYFTGVFVTLPSLLAGYTTRAQALKSFKVDMNFNVDFSEIKNITTQLHSVPFFTTTPTQFNFGFLGSYDISDRSNMKISSVLSADLGTISLEAQLRILNSTSYLQVTKISGLANLPIPMLNAYENKWFSTSYEPLSGANIFNNLTPDQINHLEKIFQDAKIIRSIVQLAPETVTGESSYHFSFDLDKAAFASYMKSYKDYMTNIGKSDAQNNAFDPTSFGKLLDQVKNPKGEIWIGRNDKLVHKVLFNFEVQPDVTKDEQAKVNIVAVVSDYNMPVSVVAPTDSIPLQSLMQASLGSAQQKGKEAAIKANLSNLRAQAEIFWSSINSYSGFCASKELITIRTAIENAGGAGFVCKDSTTKYAIGVKLSKDSGDWCVDSTGVSKATTTLPSSTVCPTK